ncbi:MAG: hypothetical protein GXP55_13555 [Deltaproteobacteria bacterium]|nr:hypothetical protein [Deltaproteobacteria bacterium]
MRMDELDELEQLAFAALVGLMVRADGELTSAESEAMARLATEVGSATFWSALSRARHELPEHDDVLRAAAGIKRPEVREWLYGVLVGISAVDGMHATEASLLDQLVEAWE